MKAYDCIAICFLILFSLIDLCLLKRYPDPTRLRNDSPNALDELRGEVEFGFIQQFSSRQIEISLSLTLRPESQKAYIDISSNKLIIPNSNITHSMTPTKILLTGNNKEISAYSLEELVTVGNKQGSTIITKMNVYSVNDGSIVLAYLGLGRTFDSPEDSLIEALHYAGIISRKQFSILYSYPEWGTLTFGNQSLFVQSNPQFKKSCSVIETPQRRWACQLEGIFFGEPSINSGYEIDPVRNKAVRIKSPAYFSTTENNIVAPYHFILFLRKHLFNPLIDSGKCYFDEKPARQLTTIHCDQNVLSSIERINFSFGDFALVYPPQKLFIKKENQKYSQFAIVSDRLNEDWILGVQFLSSFLTTFSYESNQVSFFSALGKMDIKPIKYHYDINDKGILTDSGSCALILSILICINGIGVMIASIAFYTYAYKY